MRASKAAFGTAPAMSMVREFLFARGGAMKNRFAFILGILVLGVSVMAGAQVSEEIPGLEQGQDRRRNRSRRRVRSRLRPSLRPA